MNPLVSVIVTTRNNHDTLDACLSSITNQTYEPIELVVVDRDSSDGTKVIAKYYTNLVFNCGPERSAQRNFGVSKASGQYILIVDSDMELSPHVVRDCVDTINYMPGVGGVIIPEESFGKGFWAKCKSLERSFYSGNDTIEAARFCSKDLFQQIGGYNTTMISGEDWDLSNRIRNIGRVERVSSQIRHNEGNLRLTKTLSKKFYYAGKAKEYLKHNRDGALLTSKAGPIERYKLFLSRPGRLLSNPIVGLGMLFMKTCEFGFGGLGYIFSTNRKERA